jgi:hypothetical protein
MANNPWDIVSEQPFKDLPTESKADNMDDGATLQPIDAINQVASKYGISPDNLIGLAKLETRLGDASVKGGSNDTKNLFNIKDFSGAGTGVSATDGAEGSRDKYRQYNSYLHSVEDAVSLLDRKYPGALQAASGQEFAQILKDGGYATDPGYVKKLSGVIGSSQQDASQTPPGDAWNVVSETPIEKSRTLGEAVSDFGQSIKKGSGSLSSSAGQAVDDPLAFAGATATGLAEAATTGPVRLASWAKKKLTGDGSLPFDMDKGAEQISGMFAPARDKYSGDLAKAAKDSDENNGFGSALRSAGRETTNAASDAMSAASKSRDKAYDNTEGFGALSFLLSNPGKINDMVAENIVSQAPLLLSGMGAGGVVRGLVSKEVSAASELIASSPSIMSLKQVASSGATAEIRASAQASIDSAVKDAMDMAAQRVIEKSEPYLEAINVGGESSLTVAQTASAIDDKVNQANIKDLTQVPAFQEFLKQYGNETDARRAYAAKLKLDWAPLAGMGTAAGSLITGGALAQAKALAGQVNKYGSAAKNTFKEMAEEGVQNPLEDAAQYGAESQFDPDAKYDPVKSSIEGAVTSMGQSGPMQFAKPVFNTLTGKSNAEYVAPPINPVAKALDDQIAKGNSPLSRAAATTLDPSPAQAADVSNQPVAPPDQQPNNNPIPSSQGLFSDGTPNPTAPSDSGSLSGQGVDTSTSLGAGLGADSGQATDTLRPDTADVVTPTEPTGRVPEAPVETTPIAGDPINQTWTAFHPASGTLDIPRKQMPQVKSEHRGAMVNFLKARGIGSTNEVVSADSLKPTQDKFSPAKVKQAMAFDGNDRSILVSSDNHVLDGHHQWLAKAQNDEPVKITRLDAPIAELLTAIKDFPSAGMTKDAEPNSTTETINEPQTPVTEQAAQEGSKAPAAATPVARKLVTPPVDIVAAPATQDNPGTAQFRKRRAELQHMAGKGFNRIEVNNGVSTLVNPVLNQAVALGSGIDVNLAQQAIASAQRTRDTAALGTQNDTSAAAGVEPLTQGTANRSVGDPVGSAGAAMAEPQGKLRDAEFERLVKDAGDQRSPADDAAFVDRLQQVERLRYQKENPNGVNPPSITLADPKQAKTQAVNQMLDLMAALTGQRGMAVEWSGEGSADGAAWQGRFVVDVNKPSMSAGHSIAHEFKHLSEIHPELKPYFARLYDLIPAAVKENYASGLRPGVDINSMSPADLETLQLEITADYMGEMLTNKQWMTDLAMKKPALFGAFIGKWIAALGGLIGKLKILAGLGNPNSYKLVASRFKSYANNQSTQAATAKLLADLEEAKHIAEEVMTIWAEKRPGYAKNSDAQYAKRAGPKELKYQNNYLVPEMDGAFADGNIAYMPAIAFARDGISRTYPEMPVRMRAGDHQRDKRGDFVKQYGLQHRIENAQENPQDRGYATPNGGDQVERAARDITLGVLDSQTAYADGSPTKIYLYAPSLNRSTVLEIQTDANGEKFWSVVTSMPSTREQMMRRYKAPTSVVGMTLNRERTQQAFDIKRGILDKLKEPGQSPVTSERYIIDEDGLLFNGKKEIGQTITPTVAEKKQLERDANGRIILNKNKVQRSDKDGYDMEAELQAELDAELNGSPIEIEALDVSMAEIKAKGLMAEEAMPPVAWEAAKGTKGMQLTARIPSVHAVGKTERIEMNKQGDSDLWDLGLSGTWVGPAQGEADGYASKKAVQAFAQRQVAARDLRVRGFDLAGSVSAPKLKSLVDGWKSLAQVDLADKPGQGPMRYSQTTDDDKSLKDIATSMGITDAFDVKVDREIYDPQNAAYIVRFTNKANGKDFGALLDQHFEGGKKFFTANTLDLGKGGLGSAFYQMAAEFAVRKNLPIFPESSLSGINSYRRTEQQLSAALRTGKSNVMTPHPVQRVYGFVDDAKTEAEHEANLGRLILATVRNAKELVPGFDKLRYHPETGVFTDAKGKLQEAKIAKLLKTDDARAFGMGRSTLARAALTQQLMEGVTQPEAVTSFAEPVLYSARDTAELEYQAIDDKYRGTDGWMKAPNGKPSKLNERQWIQTRTPSFQKWFGPWEMYSTTPGGVWSDDQGTVSKAVDANGEPLLVYHGTDKGGFMAFQEPGGTKRGDLGIFTTSNYDMARSYVRKGRLQDLTPIDNELDVAAWWNDEAGANEETPFADLTPEQVAEAKYRYQDEVGQYDEESNKSGIYAAFVNLRNPGEDNFDGALWSGERPDQYVVSIDGELQSRADGKQYFTHEEALEFAKEHPNPLYLDDDGADYVQPAIDHWKTTDGAVREARSDGNDGAIIREVVDDGGGPGYSLEPSDVFVAFNPNQLKSADWNTGEFGNSDDLRYSKRDTSDINPKVLEAIPEVAKLAAYLTPAEKSKLRVDTAQKMVDLYQALPSADEMAAVAYAGKAKRFWYRNSLSAIAHVFGADGWRFTGLLAATSPQCSVEINLLNALNTWKNWVAAGRPTTKEEIVAVMGRSVQGNKGEDSVLNAWVNNAVSALASKDFPYLVLSGPKVDSFMRNLLGHYYEVTNDAWIANYTLMDQKIFSGSKNKDGTEPGKGPGYLAMNAQTRKAAEKLGWQPAEIQETVWSWAMSMLETMDKQGETRGSKELLADGAMTDELINRTPDFRSLFHLPVYASILEQAGYHNALADLVTPHTVEDHGPMPFEQGKMDKLLRQAGLRLEFLQRQRRTNVQVSWEARPGESTGVLPGIHAAPIALQQQYMSDIYAAIESSGFYDKTGLSLRATLFGPGAWQGKVLPGAQTMTRPSIVADNKGGLMVDPQSRAKINVAASVLGIVLNQEGVYWHYPIYTDKAENANGIEINFGRSLTNDEMSQLYGAIIKKSGHTDWAPANTPTGVRVLNFSDKTNKDFHKIVISALPLFGKKLTSPLTSEVKRFMSDGDAIENNWKENQNAENYRSRISQARRSDLYGWIDNVLQPAVDQVNQRYSEEYDWGAATRGDIQRSTREGGPVDRSGSNDQRQVRSGSESGVPWRRDAGAGTGGRKTASGQVSSPGQVAPSYSTRALEDGSKIKGAIHFGNHPGLSLLAGSSNGTGIKGAEDERVKQSTDPRIKQRVYFYSPVDGGIPQPETGLGGSVYRADLEEIYNPATADVPIRGSGNSFESALLDAGYNGYVDPSSGIIVVLGRDVPVKHIGPIGNFKLVQRVATRFIPKNTTRTEGNELVRKPEGDEMRQLVHPTKQAKIRESAPSFKMEYGSLRVNADEAAAADQAISEFSPTFRFVTPDVLPNGKMQVKQTIDQRLDTLRELLSCLG